MLSSEFATFIRKNKTKQNTLLLPVTAQLQLVKQKQPTGVDVGGGSRTAVRYKVNPNHAVLNILGLFSGTCFHVPGKTGRSTTGTLG